VGRKQTGFFLTKHSIPPARKYRPRKPQHRIGGKDGPPAFFSIWVREKQRMGTNPLKMRQIKILEEGEGLSTPLKERGFSTNMGKTKKLAKQLANELKVPIYVLRGPPGGGERDITVAILHPQRKGKGKKRGESGPSIRSGGAIEVKSGWTNQHQYGYTDVMTPKEE
jgi:hypothetical protein